MGSANQHEVTGELLETYVARVQCGDVKILSHKMSVKEISQLDKALTNIWAKTSKDGNARWHPLILHMLDVAACADEILAREPESSQKRMAAIFGMEWEYARPWLLLIIACHDLGKACPGFQCKWLDMTGLRSTRNPNTESLPR